MHNAFLFHFEPIIVCVENLDERDMYRHKIEEK